MDRSLPSPSVLLHDPVLTEMGPGMGDPGSDTKGGKKKKKRSTVSSHQIN